MGAWLAADQQRVAYKSPAQPCAAPRLLNSFDSRMGAKLSMVSHSCFDVSLPKARSRSIGCIPGLKQVSAALSRMEEASRVPARPRVTSNLSQGWPDVST